MGYWAKDGAYMHDEKDIEVMEAMNETQGQRYDRLKNVTRETKPLFTKEEEERREAAYAKRVEERAEMYSRLKENREIEEKLKLQEEQRKLQKKAYEDAKRRYSNLNSMKKLWLKATGKDIKNYGVYNSVETLDSLYGGKNR